MEKAAIDEKSKERWDWQIIKEFPLLYVGKDKPLTESLIPFGFECHSGWKHELRRLSVQLEMLNILFYKKFGCRIQACQVKEKFGTLRFYYDIVYDGTGIVRVLNRMLDYFGTKLSMKDYGYKTVVDKPGYETRETMEYDSKEEWEKMKSYMSKNSDQTFYEKDGKYIREYTVYHSSLSHRVPTKRKLLWYTMRKVLPFAHRAVDFLDFDTYEKKVVSEYLFDKANKLVNEAEENCYKICEECGWQIGDSHSPRCETSGWITYICKDCAEKSGSSYYCNGALMKSKEVIKTKEEVDAEQKKIEDSCNS